LTCHPWDDQPIPQEGSGPFPRGASAGPTNPDLADQDGHGDSEDSHGDSEDSHGHGEGSPAVQETGEIFSPADPWRLNAERMPRSITLELPELLLAELLALAERQGRCLSEIATDLIAAQLNQDTRS
jgi:hypothetical protein